MKKIISLLVVLAMLMAMAPAVFATSTLTAGNNNVTLAAGDQDGESWTYTAQSTGTLEITVTALEYDWMGEGEYTVATEMDLQMGFFRMYALNINGTNAGSYTTTTDVTAGDVVTVELVSYNGYATNATLTFTETPAGGAAGSASTTEDIVLAAGDQDGESVTYTAQSTGTLEITVTALEYDWMGEGEYTVATEQDLQMGFFRMYALNINGTNAGSYTTTIDVTAGDVVTVELVSYNGYATNATLTFTEGSAGGSQGGGNQGGNETVNPGDLFTGTGTIDDPYVIESLADAVQIVVAGGSDIYYVYNCNDGAGAVTIADVVADGILYKLNDGSWSSGNSVSVQANDVLQINIWSNMPSSNGSANITFTAGGNAAGEADGSEDAPFIIESLDSPIEIIADQEYMGSNDRYYKYTATAPGTIVISELNGELLYSINGDNYMSDLPIEVYTGDIVILNIYGSNMTNSAVVSFESGAPVGGETTVEEGTASAEEDSTHSVFYDAPADGTLTITVGDGSAEWYSDVMDFSSFEIIASANGTEEDTYTCEVVTGGSYAIRFYGPGDPHAAIDGIPYTIVFTPAAVSGGETTVDEGTASAEEDSKHTVLYTPEFNGTLTVTVGDGNSAWVSDVMDFDTFETIPGANGTEEGTYTIDVVAGVTYCVRIYGEGDPCAAIDGIPYSIIFTPDGTEVGPQLEEFVEMVEEITEEGTYELSVSADALTTLYTFRPSATGTYKIELISGDVVMSEWSTIMYCQIAEAEDGVLTASFTDVGQSIFIGLSGEGDAQIKITKAGEADLEPDYDTIVYENQQTPIKFDDTLHVIGDNVNVDDEKVDTAVLGTDGYYHLNSADGPILYVDFFATEPSIGAAFGYGNVSYAQYDGDELVSVTNYQEALAEYMMAVNNEGNMSYGNKYHPLTADLIEILQNVGENNGWYGENGLVGDSEDAWMFSCITMVDTKFEIIEGGITTLPETLEEEGFESVEDVNNALTEALLDADKDNDKENVEHYDVILMYKDGDEWVKADENHFPESGKLTVVLPYPEGTNKNYTFTVAHMFTSDAFDKTPGDIELPKVTNTDAGIQFEVTGLSPISIAWTAPAGNAQTGDPIVVAAAVALGISAISGTALIAKKKKEF